MKKWIIYLIVGGVTLLGLAACGSTADDPKLLVDSIQADGSGQVVADTQPVTASLNDGYDDALSVQAQLALGTIRLEATDQAIDEEQAAELLPLWQALQSLDGSSTTAAVELEAVVNQIQEMMTPQQIRAIQELALTDDSLAEMIESGELAFGGGRFARAEGDEGVPAGGLGGDFPGGGPGGGGPGGGLGRGFGGDNLSEDDIATRQAAREAGEFGGFQERALTGMVVRVLAEKSGEELNDGRINIAGAIFSLTSERTGLSVGEIQAQLAEGTTLAEIIDANGGDISQVRDEIIAALEELPNATDLEVEQLADQWLNGVSQ